VDLKRDELRRGLERNRNLLLRNLFLLLIHDDRLLTSLILTDALHHVKLRHSRRIH
jgi:hypothetical protein